MYFNMHKSVTANGHVVQPDMRVRTNEWIEGVVLSDDTADHCCGESHPAGQVQIDGVWFTDHNSRAMLDCPQGLVCRHNHWFTVKYADGSTKSFDGERLWKL